jgi:uncharacterized protein (DUF1697 family)
MASSRRGAVPVVLLLRGVNVGGRAALPMAGLRALLGELGHEEARTHLQSGNAVIVASPSQARRLGPALEEAIAERFGVATRVMLRTRDEMRAVVDANPFAGAAASDPKSVHAVFLERRPARAAVGRIDPDRSPGDAVEVVGAEAYVHYPGGSGRSKLTAAYLERVLGVAATGRNWRTVTALLALAEDAV